MFVAEYVDKNEILGERTSLLPRLGQKSNWCSELMFVQMLKVAIRREFARHACLLLEKHLACLLMVVMYLKRALFHRKAGQSVEVKTARCVCVRENKLKDGRPRKLSSGKRGRPPSSDTGCWENVVTADKEKAVPDPSPVAEVDQLKVSDLELKAPQIAVFCISSMLL